MPRPPVLPYSKSLLTSLVFLLPHVSTLRTCQPELSIMAQSPIVRDFAFIKSSIPFPTTNNSQVRAPQDSLRQRTGSNSSSTSSSSGFGPYQLRSPTTSMSGRAQKQLSPVAEEGEDVPGRMEWNSGPRTGSRAGRRPGPASYVGQTGLIAEDITIAMMSMMPPPTPRQTKATARRSKSPFKNLLQSIRLRLPTMRSVCVWKRS